MKESSHWYDPKTGEARHTIIGKNGKERNTTIRDAREHGWLPSVTTIFKVCAAPELDVWKQKQVLMAALTLPKREGEPDEEYMARIMEDAFKQVEDAADLGTRVHKAIEDHFQGRPYDPELSVFIDSLERWLDQNKVTFKAHEIRVLCPEIGYAGTTDALITVQGKDGVGIMDFKTRKSKPDYPMKPYSKEPMQIAAYAYTQNATFGVNVFLSTTQPGRIEAAWYDKGTLDSEMEAFRHVVKYWQHVNKYVPAIEF
jgi:hypothetical protein